MSKLTEKQIRRSIAAYKGNCTRRLVCAANPAEAKRIKDEYDKKIADFIANNRKKSIGNSGPISSRLITVSRTTSNRRQNSDRRYNRRSSGSQNKLASRNPVCAQTSCRFNSGDSLFVVYQIVDGKSLLIGTCKNNPIN